MLALTAVVSHFQPDTMSFKTSSLLPRSGGGPEELLWQSEETE